MEYRGGCGDTSLEAWQTQTNSNPSQSPVRAGELKGCDNYIFPPWFFSVLSSYNNRAARTCGLILNDPLYLGSRRIDVGQTISLGKTTTAQCGFSVL